jgi:hypothetical protein
MRWPRLEGRYTGSIDSTLASAERRIRSRVHGMALGEEMSHGIRKPRIGRES